MRELALYKNCIIIIIIIVRISNRANTHILTIHITKKSHREYFVVECLYYADREETGYTITITLKQFEFLLLV